MEKVMQCVVKFYAPGTVGAVDEEKSIENAIFRMNSEGWRVDQIMPLSFRFAQFSKEGLEVTSGILLCSRIE